MAISETERQKRRERIQQVKPWLKSTGPRTRMGKAISSHNAYKHGLYSQMGLVREFARVELARQEAEIQLNRVCQILETFQDRNLLPPSVLELVTRQVGEIL